MHEQILALFPAHTHALTAVSDPDRLLAAGSIVAELSQRGFVLVDEPDPVVLRHRVEELRPFSIRRPVILVSAQPLEDIPYDLYEAAHRLSLSLHQFFPNLAYPVLQELAPEQLERLDTCPPPPQPLGRQKTLEHLLEHVFEADPAALAEPAALIAWLDEYHHRGSTLPGELRSYLVGKLERFASYKDWDLPLIIEDAQAFARFVQEQWEHTVEGLASPGSIGESRAEYPVAFDRDARLQALMPALVRRGTLRPHSVPSDRPVPEWARPGVTVIDARLVRRSNLFDQAGEELEELGLALPARESWKRWKQFAADWAELASLQAQLEPDTSAEQLKELRQLAATADRLFQTWLASNYTPLAAQRLPVPHHVYHVPHYLAYLRELHQADRVALFVLDGFSWADWQTVSTIWTRTHLNWSMKTDTLLAEVPTITFVSRHALISGLRPADFLGEGSHLASDEPAWRRFWSSQGVAETACGLAALSYDRGIDQRPELENPRVRFWCLIDDTPDKLAHNATLGAADQQASLRLWLDPAHEPNSGPLESWIDFYLERGYTVFIASDHGHVQATGIGQPAEGLEAETYSKRARLYGDRLAALRVRQAFADTLLWEKDGLLPEGMVALMPKERSAFAPAGQVLVTHGGISVEEAMVPFIHITKATSP